MTKAKAIVARTSILAFALVSAVSTAAFAQGMHVGQEVRSMKLLTSNVGWAATEYHVYLTTDGGAHWKNITPPVVRRTRVVAAFFLDRATGWVLLAAPYVAHPKTSKRRLSLARTANGGESWSIKRLVIPKSLSGTLFIPSGYIAFADALHGWINLDIQSSSNFDFGGLLITSDGGRSWQAPQSDAGIAGPIGLVTPKEGWTVGGPSNMQFWMTHDGSKTWQRISLPAPAGIYSPADSMQMFAAGRPAYGVPTFTDPEHGFVVATYPGYSPVKSAAVLFETTDGGRAWKPDGRLTDLPEGSGGSILSSAVIGSTWVIVKARRFKSPRLIKLKVHATANGSAFASDCTTGMACLANSWISFVTPMIGWITPAGGGPLLSTADGGMSWRAITPGLPRRSAERLGSW